MRVLLILVIPLLNLPNLCGQEMYSSSLVDLHKKDTYAKMIVPHEDGSYTIIGEARDVIGPWPPFCAKFTENGELIEKENHPTIDDSAGISSTSTYAYLNDTIIGFVIYSKNKIYRVNINQTSFIEPIVYGENREVSYNTIRNCNDGYLMAGVNVPDEGNRYASFTVLDSLYNIVFTRPMTRFNYNTFCTNVWCNKDNYIVNGWEHTGHAGEGTLRTNTYARSFNQSGQLKWEYIGGGNHLDSIYQRTGDLLIDEDGGIVYTYSRSTRREKNGFGDYTYSAALYMVKLDKNGNELWDIPIGHDMIATYVRSNKIIASIDDEAYIVTGTFPGWDYTEERDWLADPYNEEGDTVSELAFVSKINYDGEVLWQRNYKGWGNAIFGPNVFTDQIPNKDGTGYLLIGQSSRPLIDGNEIFAWLWRLHVDNYGCLVPGCHLGDTTSITDENVLEQEVISVFPNPSSDITVISHNTGYAAVYELYSFDGQKIRSYNAGDIDHDILLSTSELARGTYLITRRDKDGVVNEKLVIR